MLLERPPEDDDRRELISQARREIEALSRDDRWRGLKVEPPDDEEAAFWLERSGMRLLDKLIAQQKDMS